MPDLHEIWTWEGDTSILPHKVTEILNSVSVFDENDPKFADDDPFEAFERPYKADEIKARLKCLMADNAFQPDGFFFLTNRSQAVGCCMVLTTPEKTFKIEYLSTIPGSIGSGVEQSLILLALKFCFKKCPEGP